MATSEVLLAQPYDFVQDGISGAAADVTVTKAAPASDMQHILQAVLVSVSAAPAAAVKCEVIQDAGGSPTTLATFYIPAAAIQPLYMQFKGIKVAAGKSISVKVPSLGGSGIATATLFGMTRSAG